jgi:hypothetical protein
MIFRRFSNVSRWRSKRTSPAGDAIQLVALERRIMMHVDPNDPIHVDELPDDLGVFPAIQATAAAGDSTSASTASLPLSSVPALDSNAAASNPAHRRATLNGGAGGLKT